MLLGILAAADAELRASAESAPPSPPAINSGWGGLYLGGHMGEGFGQLHGDSSDQAGTLPGARLQGLIGGYQIGYNFHLPNNLVLGAEADVSFGSFSGMTHRPPLTFGHYDANFDYFGTARARAGWAMGRLLPYLTSGLAWGRHKVAFDSVDGETHGLLRTHWGWTVGAGLEYAVDGHWTLKGEFLYADFNRRRYGRLFFGEAREAAVPFRPSVSAFKLGLNYKFQDGWAAASTAKPILKPPAWITPDDWSIHAQTTFIWQGYPRFRSPYEGEHSLFGGKQARNTWSVTGFIGRRLTAALVEAGAVVTAVGRSRPAPALANLPVRFLRTRRPG